VNAMTLGRFAFPENSVCSAPAKIHPESAMNIPVSRRKNAFTLVELLVVISIIVVLASFGIGAALKGIETAKKNACLATCTGIVTAVENFYNEYNTMPKKDLADDPAVPINTKTDIEFLNVLLALPEKDSPELNTKKIKFLKVTEGKNKKNGLIWSTAGNSVTGLFDPWGGPYYVMLDGNLDDVIKVKPAAAAKETILHDTKVAVWSNGADGVSGKGGTVSDDVKTWKD